MPSAFSLGKVSPAGQKYKVGRRKCPVSHREQNLLGFSGEGQGAPRRSDRAYPRGHFGFEPVPSSCFGDGRRDHTVQEEKFLRTRALLAASVQDVGFLPSLRSLRK